MDSPRQIPKVPNNADADILRDVPAPPGSDKPSGLVLDPALLSQISPIDCPDRSIPPTPGADCPEEDVDADVDMSEDGEALPGLNGQDEDVVQDQSAAVTRVDSLVPPSQGPAEVEEVVAEKGGDEDEDSSDDEVVIPSPPKKPRAAIVPAEAVEVPPNSVVVAKVFVVPTDLELECTKKLAACVKAIHRRKRKGEDLSRMKAGHAKSSKEAKKSLSDARDRLAVLKVEKRELRDDQGAIRQVVDEKIAAIKREIKALREKIAAERRTSSGAIEATRQATRDVLNHRAKLVTRQAVLENKMDSLRQEHAKVVKDVVEIDITTTALKDVCEGTGVIDAYVKGRLDAAMRDGEAKWCDDDE